MRSLCVGGFPIGDTITAKLHPARVGLTRPKWWPRQFLVIFRLDTPVTVRDSALLRLVVIGATIDGVVVRGAQGNFWVDVESMHVKAGEHEVSC